MLVTEKTFIVSDDLALPAGKPAPERILSVSAELRVTDTQDIGGKLIVKGAVRTCVYYLPQNGDSRNLQRWKLLFLSLWIPAAHSLKSHQC